MKEDYITSREQSKFFNRLAEQKELVEVGNNRWKHKTDFLEELGCEPRYYKLTPLGFQPINPVGFTKNSEIDNTLKPKTFILAMVVGFLFGILIMRI